MSTISEESGSNTDLNAARKYQVLMELGRGGTAVVSAGLARGIGGFTKLVVLKKIKEEFLSDRETVRMFINEARLSALMNHPNVVQVYEVFRQNRLPVIVMEYLDGQSLARIQARAFQDPAYTTAMAIGIVCRVLAAVHYAHCLADYDGTPLELVHRDVSPHNVMLTYDGQVKLVDFGIAKLHASSQHTNSGVVKGKIAYMAPEQLEGGQLDQRADLFAAGVMLWELIARRRLWGSRSDAEIVRCLVLDDVPQIRATVPGIDPELTRICGKALAVNADARYASAAEFQADLERYLGQRAISVRDQDIADLVTRICAELRDHSAERLKAELVKFSAGAPGWEDPLTAFDALQTPVPLPGARSRGWWLAVSAILAIGGAGLVLRWGSEPADPLPAAPHLPPQLPAPPLPRPPLPAPEVAAPMQVMLRVSATPPEAVISLDGKPLAAGPLAAGPLALSLPKDELEHELRADAAGYEPLTRRVRLDADLELSLELEALFAPTAKPSADRVARAKRRPTRADPAPDPTPSVREEPAPVERTEPRTEPSVADCNPPYYIGPDGLKQYRRECL